MPDSPTSVIVLAAGEGTRMRSSLPKVLHGFAGRTLLGHVLHATAPLGAARTLVVVGHRRADVIGHLADIAPYAEAVVQHEQNGSSGQAVRLALEAIPAAAPGTVVVVPGDAPLLTGDVLADLVADHETSGAAATVLTSVLNGPTGCARIIRASDNGVARVLAQLDASEAELAVTEVATGVYAFDHALLRHSIGAAGANGETHLHEVIGVLAATHRIGATMARDATTTRVDDRVQLAAAHRAYNTRLLEAHMRAGVTVIDPLTTWVDASVTIEPDATLWPSVDLHGVTHIGAGASIGPQVTLTDTMVGANARISRAVAVQANVGAGVTIGPFAYLRPGTVLAAGARIGSYVELKNAEVGEGTKVPHLTYVGDATIGEYSNIGGATVFVNYDGVAKHHTVIGSHVRTGADNIFVAPVTVGDGAYTAAGSVITRDVPPGAIGVARANQRNVAGWVARQRPGTPAAEAAARALEEETHPG